MLKMVPLSKIKDNPYRDKKRNPVVPARVEQLKESIQTTGFWNGVYGREKETFIEIAFGHTRIDAARVLGLKEVPVEIVDLSDSDMLMRMARENLRGEIVVSLEAVNAAVKAFGVGSVDLGAVDPSTRKDALRYAPSFIPSKAPSASGASRPYTADTLARFLGGVYVQPDKTAQDSVRAALGVLEMEERKVSGFSERVLRAPTKTVEEEDIQYLSAKKVLQIVSEVKAREVKIAERTEKTKQTSAEFDVAQRKLQAERKAAEEKAEEERQKLIDKLAKAKEEEDDRKTKEIRDRLEAKAKEERVREERFVEKKLALDVKLAETKKKQEEERRVDEYAPLRRETDRILHKMEQSKEALTEEVKALSRQKLNTNDRERLRQSAIKMGEWYDWVSMLFLPPLSSKPRKGTK